MVKYSTVNNGTMVEYTIVQWYSTVQCTTVQWYSTVQYTTMVQYSSTLVQTIWARAPPYVVFSQKAILHWFKKHKVGQPVPL